VPFQALPSVTSISDGKLFIAIGYFLRWR
jgi:hypothetical protein